MRELLAAESKTRQHMVVADVPPVTRIHSVLLCVAQPPPPAFPGSMEHVWQSLQLEEGAEGADAANGLQDVCSDGPKNGSHPAAQPREKCWIHRVRAAAVYVHVPFVLSPGHAPPPVCWHGTRRQFGVSCLSS